MHSMRRVPAVLTVIAAALAVAPPPLVSGKASSSSPSNMQGRVAMIRPGPADRWLGSNIRCWWGVADVSAHKFTVSIEGQGVRQMPGVDG